MKLLCLAIFCLIFSVSTHAQYLPGNYKKDSAHKQPYYRTSENATVSHNYRYENTIESSTLKRKKKTDNIPETDPYYEQYKKQQKLDRKMKQFNGNTFLNGRN